MVRIQACSTATGIVATDENNTVLISFGSGAPDGSDPGLLYIRTDGTDEDARIYFRGDPAANDWTAVAAP